MIVDPKDGSCRTCGSTLRVIDADDAALTVSCIECRDTYEVETDAFGDGCMTYYLGFLEETLRHRQKGANP
jgi:hypothetical protein